MRISVPAVISLMIVVEVSQSQTWKELLVKADALMRAGQVDSAVNAGRRGLENPRELFTCKDTVIANLAFGLARKYRELEVYDLAEICYDANLKIRRSVLGSENADVANALNGLAIMLWLEGRNDEAEALNQEALSIRERLLGKDHLDVSESLTNLGLVLLNERRYREAQDLFVRSLAIERKNRGDNDLGVAQSQMNLGNAFYLQADYTRAEEYYTKALSTRQKLLGKDDPDIAQIYDNLGDCYSDQGRNNEAETLYKKALAIFQASPSGEKRDLAICLENLGILYTQMHKLELAESYLRQALELRRTIFQGDNQETAETYANLADVLSRTGRQAEAESLYLRAIPISNDDLRPPMMLGLANLYRDNSNYSKAESLYGDIDSLWHRFPGIGHPQQADFLESYSVFLRGKGDASRAEVYARSALGVRKKFFTTGAWALSERDALTYSLFVRRSLSNYLSCAFRGGSRFMQSHALSDFILSSKGVVSDLIFARRNEGTPPADSQAALLGKRLRRAQASLVRLFSGEMGSMSPAAYTHWMDSLSGLCNKLESQIAHRSASFRQMKDYENVSASRISSFIPSGSTLVEYLKWDFGKLKPDTTIAHYLAIILDRRNKPSIMDLGEAAMIDHAVNRYRQHLVALAGKLAQSGMPVSENDQKEYVSIASALYRLVWQPLESRIKDRNTVFVAPDGGLNLVSFAGLINEQGAYLIEKYPLHYLSAGRDLIRLRRRGGTGAGLIAFGDPDYNASVTQRFDEARKIVLNPSARMGRGAANNIRSGCGTLREINVGRLFSTRAEVDSIAEYWKHDYRTEPVSVYTDAHASEENFKSKSHGRRVIHLATHGYFIQSQCPQNRQRSTVTSEPTYTGENPLLLSGLFLAGANLHGAGTEDTQAEDGIVSALEVSAMDLGGTDLVVLSACETGLGEVKQGEGVYGLRRAFQTAGARTVVSALWQVPDNETKMLMKTFYSQKGATYPELMQSVALQHIHDLKLIGRPTHPYSWGGFVATGDWRRE